MTLNESIEYFPIFDPETTVDAPGVSAAIGTTVAAIGSPDALGGSGALVIYFYSRERKGWGYVGVLSGSKIDGMQQVRGLGSSCVAVGDTLIVGARGDATTPGRVFVLSPPYGAWTYTAIPVIAELARKEPAKGDGFGASVAHCFDGANHYVAVGAPTAAPPLGKSGGGQVFIFKGLQATNAPWSSGFITSPDPAAAESDQFGASVALSMSGDGSGAWDGTLTLAVGAPGAAAGQGAVFIGRTAEKDNWSGPIQFAEALAPSFPGAAEDFKTSGFGTAVALSGGVSLAVGSPSDPNSATQTEGTGAVWTYRYQDGAWAENPAEARLFGPAAEARFGASLAFSPTAVAADGSTLEEGNVLLVGAPGAGRAYRYLNDEVAGRPGGVTYTADDEHASLVGKPSDGFGSGVALSACDFGTWSFVASPGSPKTGLEGGGFLFVHGEGGPKWMETPALIAEPPVRWGGMNPDWWKRWTPEIPRYLS